MNKFRFFALAALLFLVFCPYVSAAGDIKGRVVDASGQPVIDAAVLVNGNTASGVITDLDGNFTVKAAAMQMPGTKSREQLSLPAHGRKTAICWRKQW